MYLRKLRYRPELPVCEVNFGVEFQIGSGKK